MKIELIKPIPKYIVELIRKKDRKDYPAQNGVVRFYSYLTKNDGELVKMTVAVRNRNKIWYCKQCVMHGIHSDKCYVKDMVFYYVSGYQVGWYAEGLQKEPKWYEDDKWGWQDDKLFDPYAPIVNKEYLAKFPEYKYAAWETHPYVDILKYLRLYEKYPQIEYLTKLGMHDLAESVTVLRQIGKDKKFCKWLISHRNDTPFHRYYVSTILQAYKTGRPFEVIQRYESRKKSFAHEKDYSEIRKLFRGKLLERFFDYIDNQKTNYRSYLDYLTACNYLGLDMTIDKNRFPHDFKRWHDIRSDEYATKKALADKKERAELYEKFSAVANKYLPLQYDKQNAFIVVIAASPADLIREGDFLHHCVGRMGYDQKFAREETLIFFIRNKADVEKPFVTVEYSLKNKKVLQCYGEGDSRPDESVLSFVNKKWLPYANRQIKKLQIAA